MEASSFYPSAKKQKVEKKVKKEEAFLLIYGRGVKVSIYHEVIQEFEKMGLTLKRLRFTNVDSEFGKRFMDFEFWLQFFSDAYKYKIREIRPNPEYYDVDVDDELTDSSIPFITEYNDSYDPDDRIKAVRPPLVHLFGTAVMVMTFEGKHAIAKIRKYTTLDTWEFLYDSFEFCRIKGNMMYSSATPLRAENDIKYWFGDRNLEWLHDYTKKEVAWRYPFVDDKQDKYSPLLCRKYPDVELVDPLLVKKEGLRLIRINRSGVLNRHVGEIVTSIERLYCMLFGMRLIGQEDFVKNEKYLSSIGLNKDQLPVVVMVFACVRDGQLEGLKERSTANINWGDIWISDSVEDIYKWFPCGMVHWPLSYRYTRLPLFEGP